MTATTDVIEWGLERARTGPWRGNSRIAYLAPSLESPPPSPEFIQRCVGELARRGYTEVITAALGPKERPAFTAVGFEQHERLRLLIHDLQQIPSPSPVRLRRAARSHRRQVLELDAAAFDPFWRFDGTGLDDALDATPDVRFRVAAGGGRVMGYAISGRGGRQGYLQRLAVHPACRRAGLGRALVIDGLRWMRRRGADRAVVNTQLDNDAAVALYLRTGFREEPSGLVVLRRALAR